MMMPSGILAHKRRNVDVKSDIHILSWIQVQYMLKHFQIYWNIKPVQLKTEDEIGMQLDKWCNLQKIKHKNLLKLGIKVLYKLKNNFHKLFLYVVLICFNWGARWWNSLFPGAECRHMPVLNLLKVGWIYRVSVVEHNFSNYRPNCEAQGSHEISGDSVYTSWKTPM
jgi:hypothetical protein